MAARSRPDPLLKGTARAGTPPGMAEAILRATQEHPRLIKPARAPGRPRRPPETLLTKAAAPLPRHIERRVPRPAPAPFIGRAGRLAVACVAPFGSRSARPIKPSAREPAMRQTARACRPRVRRPIELVVGPQPDKLRLEVPPSLKLLPPMAVVATLGTEPAMFRAARGSRLEPRGRRPPSSEGRVARKTVARRRQTP